MIFFKRIKSLKHRDLFYKYEIYFKVLKILFINLISKNILSLYKLSYYTKFLKKKNQIHNFCIISSKASSIFRKYRISRHFFRRLNASCFFFGLKKASW